MDTPDLKSLFPSFDLKLACILHLTLDVPQEACNHICEALIIAGATTWTRFICDIYEYGYIVDLEYQAQTGPHSISIKDQHTLTTFVDLINDIIPQAGCHWYDHNQYTRDVFLAFCNARNQHPELTAFHKANAAIPLAPFPHVTVQVPLASQPSVQATPCLTKPVLTPVSSLVSVPVTPQAPVLVTPPAHVLVTPPAPDPVCGTPVISTIAQNGNPLESPETHRLAPNTDLPASTSTPTYTWTYFPSTKSVCFRKVVSSTIPIVHPDTPPGDASHTTSRERHFPSPSPSSKPSAHSRWTFHPKSDTVTFHWSPKQFSSHTPSTCNPPLQLLPFRALSKDSAVPSSVHAKDSAVPNSVHVYSQHGASSWQVPKPTYEAYSLTFDLPAVCITKRHHDAIKLKMYHLHATLLLANWLYDAVT
eukprot:jgi/Psemu1/59088/gm1.59088_g